MQQYKSDAHYDWDLSFNATTASLQATQCGNAAKASANLDLANTLAAGMSTDPSEAHLAYASNPVVLPRQGTASATLRPGAAIVN